MTRTKESMQRRSDPIPPAPVSTAPPTPMEVLPLAHDPHQAPRYAGHQRGLEMSLPLAKRSARLMAQLYDALALAALSSPVLGSGLLVSHFGMDARMTARLAPLIAAVGIVVFTAYQIVRLTREGQTLGKKLAGVRIVNFPDGGNPGFLKAVVVRLVLNVILCGTLVWLALDLLFIFRRNRRCLHDWIAGTAVVDCRSVNSP